MADEIFSMDRIAAKMGCTVAGFVVIWFAPLDTSHNQLKLSTHLHWALHLNSVLWQIKKWSKNEILKLIHTTSM